MVSRARAPVWPSRPYTATFCRSRPSASATTSPMRSAVPDGASTLCRWWASMISMSTSSPSTRAAVSSSFRQRLTPTLKLAAKTIGISLATSASCFFSSTLKPVVPITMALPASRQMARLRRVTLGWVKSISTSNSSSTLTRSEDMVTPSRPRPFSSTTSAPIRMLSGRSTAAASTAPWACITASMRFLPMRPAAPITAIRRITLLQTVRRRRLRIAGCRLNVAEEALHAFEPAAGLGRMRTVALQGTAKLLEQLALTLGQVDRRFDRHAAHQVARSTAAHRRDALAAQAEQLAGLGAFRNLQLDPAIQGRHFQLAAERRVGEADRNLAVQVLAVTLEDRVFADTDHHVEVAGR